MSILIKGIEMPKSCEDCHLESFCSLWVEARRICKWSPDNREAFIRHPNCPLVPVPPHGRLIDADAMKTRIEGSDYHTIAVVKQWVDDQPTVIESDGER